MTVSDAIDEFLIFNGDVKGLSQNTVASYRNDLSHFALLLFARRGGEVAPRAAREAERQLLKRENWTHGTKSSDEWCNECFKKVKSIEIEAVTTEDVLTTIGTLSRLGRSPVSVNRYLAAVRMLFEYCRKCGYIGENVTAKIKTLKTPKRIPVFLTAPEVDALCAQPVRHELLWETRDKAILEMLYSSGCRVSELAGMRLCDMDADASSAIIMGKGGKERKVFFEKDARNAFKSYMADRKRFFAEHGKVDDVPQVFVNQKCGPLTRRGILLIVSRYSGGEGTRHHISPHKLRHTFATSMMTQGCDIRLIQEMLGHKKISTTQKYTHVTTEQLIAAYNKAHPHAEDKQLAMPPRGQCR